MVEILEIDGIETKSYTMWYRFSKSLKQKVTYVGNKKVSSNAKISYICPSCDNISSTSLRTFNDRVGNYDLFYYMCKSCVDKNHNLEDFSSKQEETKRKNGTRPKDIIEKTGKLGFIGKDQKSGSDIRNKMNETKTKNNTFGNKGTDSYNNRITNWELKTEDEKVSIYKKIVDSKIKNGTSQKQKVERGETFGFVGIYGIKKIL